MNMICVYTYVYIYICIYTFIYTYICIVAYIDLFGAYYNFGRR